LFFFLSLFPFLFLSFSFFSLSLSLPSIYSYFRVQCYKTFSIE
jgi:hypothetical protein